MSEQQEQRFATLKLPKRYEALEREATQNNADLARIVQRVDTAASRVETLLRQVRDGGLGRFEVFLGPSGSGKTTFFKTLTRFFSGTDVHEISSGMPLDDIASHIRTHNYKNASRQVWVLVDRDNPTLTPDDAFKFFESLRVLFREDAGRVVICWPITDVPQAEMLSRQAWTVHKGSSRLRCPDVVSRPPRGVKRRPMQDYTYTLRTSVMCEEGVRSLGGLGPTWMA